MLDQSTKFTQMWTETQTPRTPSYVSNSYLLLLSALDNGWRVRHVELAPSWDQLGLIYIVTLRRDRPDYAQQLILPKNALSEELLAEMNVI